jgi:hypothetical protein
VAPAAQFWQLAPQAVERVPAWQLLPTQQAPPAHWMFWLQLVRQTLFWQA